MKKPSEKEVRLDLDLQEKIEKAACILQDGRYNENGFNVTIEDGNYIYMKVLSNPKDPNNSEEIEAHFTNLGYIKDATYIKKEGGKIVQKIKGDWATGKFTTSGAKTYTFKSGPVRTFTRGGGDTVEIPAPPRFRLYVPEMRYARNKRIGLILTGAVALGLIGCGFAGCDDEYDTRMMLCPSSVKGSYGQVSLEEPIKFVSKHNTGKQMRDMSFNEGYTRQ